MIVKPENMSFKDKNLIMIISGLPGTGKTTLALSAPDVLLIDTDEGICRVRPEHRRDSSMCKTYEDILADIKAAEGTYKTIVIDTAGALIDYIKDFAVRTDAKASKSSGGISLQGFGIVKQEFLRLSNELRKKFNVIYLFHEQMEKNNEEVFYSIICEGAAKTLVYQPADLAAHLFIQNGERYLGFTPTANYTAKAAYGIKGLVKVPELPEGTPNNFLEKLFATVRTNLEKESEALLGEKAKYEKAMADGMEFIKQLEKPEEASGCAGTIKALEHALTSEKELKAAFNARLSELGIKWDKETKAYVYAEDK